MPPPLLARDPATPTRVAAVLSDGGIAVVPAEGVYGLVARPDQPAAIARVREAKRRGADMPFLGLVHDWSEAAGWMDPLPAYARPALTPGLGALTLLVRPSSAAPPALVGPTGWIGLRRAADAFGRALAAAAGGVVLSTSANLTGQPAPRAFAEIDAAVRSAVDVAVDGEAVLSGLASTIVEVGPAAVRVVREGAVPVERLRAALGDERVEDAAA